jgi:hypothetical protein
MNATVITCLVLTGVLVVFCVYLFLKVHNTSKRIVKLTDFMHGDVFSDRFHHVLSNYFLDNGNVKSLLVDPITPIVIDIVSQHVKQQTRQTRQTRQAPDTPTKNVQMVSKDVHLFL